MKILHIWDIYSPGLFDHSFDICREQGVTAKLLCQYYYGDPNKAADSVEWIDCKSISGKKDSKVDRVFNYIRQVSDTVKFLERFARVIKDFQPDLVHFHYGTTAAKLLAKIMRLRIPYLISFYGFDISQGIRSPKIKAAYQKILPNAAMVQVLCREARERALALGARPEAIWEENLPLNLSRYPELPISKGYISKWLIPARFIEKKGHRIALLAFRELLKHQHDAHLTCWGYGETAQLMALIDSYGLNSSVTVIDNRLQVEFDSAYIDQLRCHDVILAPSIQSSRGDDEGGPALTAVLAQATGKPVIYSDFPGSECSVTNGVEGYIVPQGDSQKLLDAMLALTKDVPRARAMGLAGRARVMREFDRRRYGDSLISLYSNIIT
jgi:colanic acid/amylovoran biosynthesis glycosyltransferase